MRFLIKFFLRRLFLKENGWRRRMSSSSSIWPSTKKFLSQKRRGKPKKYLKMFPCIFRQGVPASVVATFRSWKKSSKRRSRWRNTIEIWLGIINLTNCCKMPELKWKSQGTSKFLKLEKLQSRLNILTYFFLFNLCLPRSYSTSRDKLFNFTRTHLCGIWENILMLFECDIFYPFSPLK